MPRKWEAIAMNYSGGYAISQIDALEDPPLGMTVSINSVGTPAAPGSDALSDGDIAQFQGERGWRKLVSGIQGGWTPARTAVIATEAQPHRGHVTVAVRGNRGEFTGTSPNMPTWVAPTEGQRVRIPFDIGGLDDGKVFVFRDGEWLLQRAPK